MIQYLTYGNSYGAIEYAEQQQFYYLQLTKKKQEFVISGENQYSSLEETLKGVQEQKHLFLIINNEQVLSKKIEIVGDNTMNVLRTAFPNITISDFYYEIFSSDTNSFISVARKEYVDNLIEKYKKAGIAIVDFSLGNNAIKYCADFIENQTICTSNVKVEIENNQIIAIQKTIAESERYVINDLAITNTHVLPLSGIISYYYKNNTSVIGNSLRETFHQKQFFSLGLKAGLGFIFLLLLINFIFFSSYRNEINNLNGELLLSETYKKQLTTLQNQVTQKTGLVKSMNTASNANVSKYIDEIGVSVPEQVLLTQINYQPIEGVLKKDKPIFFIEKQIRIAGISKNNTSFSDWMTTLEKKDWITKVSIASYGKGTKSTTTAEFECTITISND